MIRRIFLVFSFAVIMVKGFSPEAILTRIKEIKEVKRYRYNSYLNDNFETKGNFWLIWEENDFVTNVQKFNSDGVPFFPPVKLDTSKLFSKPEDIGSSWFFVGNSGDLYFFPGWNFTIIRIDNKGDFYKTDSSISQPEYIRDMFIDSRGIMHVFSRQEGFVDKYTKWRIQSPLPTLIEDKNISPWYNDKKDLKLEYRQVYDDLKYFDPKEKYILFVNLSHSNSGYPSYRLAPQIDTTRIYISQVRLSNLQLIDTISFQIKDALHKKIKGCRLKLKESSSGNGALVKGNGDTLLLYLPGRDTLEEILDLVYLCKIKKDGTPIKAKEVKEEEVRDFNTTSKNLHLEIALWGRDWDHFHSTTYVYDPSGGPNGMMIYGFDKSGNMYYYVWDKSDYYWKKK